MDPTPETEQADWLSDGHRRALLAAVCVGTIDQAILGILPTTFSELRLCGRSDKLPIVDEAQPRPIRAERNGATTGNARDFGWFRYCDDGNSAVVNAEIIR